MLPGSAALNVGGDPAAVLGRPLDTDQRGFPRRSGTSWDAGAVENTSRDVVTLYDFPTLVMQDSVLKGTMTVFVGDGVSSLRLEGTQTNGGPVALTPFNRPAGWTLTSTPTGYVLEATNPAPGQYTMPVSMYVISQVNSGTPIQLQFVGSSSPGATGVTTSRTVTVEYPAPRITSVSPSTVDESSTVNLTVRGVGFGPGSTVRWNGTDAATQFVDGTQLTATVPAALVYPGTVSVTVFTPSPGGGTSSAAFVTVNDLPPSIVVSGTGAAAEGSPYTLNLGPATDPVTWWGVQWGDGTRDAYTSGGTVSHTYADNGTYVVTVDLVVDGRVVMNAGNAHSVAVENVAPTPTITALSNPRVEGTAITVEGSAIDPAGVNDTIILAWIVTDPDGFTAFGNGSSVTFTPPDDGEYEVSLYAFDEDGGVSVAATTTVGVMNADPVPSITAVSSPTVAGAAITVTGSATDPGGANDALTLEWSIEGPGGFSANGAGSSVTFMPPADGEYTVTLTADDTEGGLGETRITLNVGVANPTPTITAVSSPAVEGTPITLTGSGTNPAGVSGSITLAWTVNNPSTGLTLRGSGPSFTFTPPDDGRYYVYLTASNEFGGLAETRLTLNVANMPPVPTIESVSNPRVEGTPITVTGSAVDPAGVNDTVDLAWEVTGPGGFTDIGGGSSFTFTPPDDGTYTVSLYGSDEDMGLSEPATTTVVVGNVAPTFEVIENGTAAEGAVYWLNLGAITDPGTDTLESFVIHWGDGSTSDSSELSHRYADDGTYTVTVDVVDEDGTFTNVGTPLTVTVTNVAPTPTIGAVSGSRLEGLPITVTGSATDPAAFNDTVSLTWAVTGPNGFTATGNGPGFTFTPPDNGNYTVSLVASDEDGGVSAPVTTTVGVGNVAPTAAGVAGPVSLTEGQSGAYALTLPTDAGGDRRSLRYSFALDPGALAADYSAALDVNSFTPTFADDGTFAVYGRVYDKDGGISAVYSTTITVANVAPTAAIVAVSNPTVEGTAITVGGSATDPAGVNDSVALAWSVTGPGGFTASGSGPSVTFTPTDDGSYSVTLTASDEDGGRNTATTTVAVGNVAPTATFGNGGAVSEGTAGTVTFSAQFDPSAADAAGLRYAYDFDDDGTIDVGSLAYANASTSASVSVPTADNPGRTVRGYVIDKDGGATPYLTTIAVSNVPPTATGVGGPTTLAVGQAGVYSLTAPSDAAADQASLRYSFALSPGGLAADYAHASAANAFTHTPTSTGTFTVYARVYDKDGGVSATYSTTVTAIAAGLKFDMQAATSSLPDASWRGVRGNNLYSAATGYGWAAAAKEADKATNYPVGATAAERAMYRDYNYGSGTAAFKVYVGAYRSASVKVYSYPASIMSLGMTVSATNGTTARLTTAAAYLTVTGTTGADGVLTLNLRGGVFGRWLVNGIEVTLA